MGLNIGASSTQLTLLNNNRRTNKDLGRATERLATGQRINHASEDPAGLIGAEQLRGDLVEISAQLRANSSLQRQTNVQQQGRQIASDVLIEVRGLIVEASNFSASGEQQQAIQQQIDQSLDALGSVSDFDLPAELETLRTGGSNSVADGNGAEAIEVLEEQLSTIHQASAAAGAYQKYTLDVDQRLAEDKAVATAQALSLQEDADFAQETSNLVKNQILNEASIKTIALSQKIQREGTSLLFDALV